MKEKVKVLKAAIAIIFADLDKKHQIHGKQYKYTSAPIEEEDKKGWEFSIIVKEAAYPDRTIQQWKFLRPDNIDKYNMEYNVLMTVLSALTDTALVTWDEVGKHLNTDFQMQQTALESLKQDDN